MENSNERKETEKTYLLFQDLCSTSELRKKKAVEVFEFMMDTYSLKLTQFEKKLQYKKLGSDNKNPISKLEVNHIFRDLYTFAVQ